MRRVGAGRQAAVAVDVGREDRHRLGHRRRHAADRVAQRVAALGRLAVLEDVAAGLVEQADMEMQAAARPIDERLRDEGRLDAVALGRRLDDALEQHAVVGRGQRVVGVHQVDLVLAGREFGAHRRRGDVLRGTERGDLGEQLGEVVELGDAVNLQRIRAPPGARHDRHLRHAVGGALGVDQVELELDRDDRGQAVLGEALDDAGQNVARVGDEPAAVRLEGRHQHLTARPAGPGDRRQRAGHRLEHVIRVAVAEAAATRVAGAAGDVEQERRAGQQEPFAVELLGVGAAQPLAAQDARQVRDEGVDHRDVRMTREKIVEFGLPRRRRRSIVHLPHSLGRAGPASRRFPLVPRTVIIRSLILGANRMGDMPIMSSPTRADRRIVATGDAAFVPFDRYGEPIPKLSWLPISYDAESGQGSFLIRFEPGGRSLPHEHTGYEEFVVLEGALIDNDGAVFRAGDLVSFEPGSRHSSHAPDGCLLAVFMRGINRPLEAGEDI